MNKMIKRYQTPQIFQVRLQTFQTSTSKSKKGNYFVWLCPPVQSLIISKTDNLRPSSLAIKFSNIIGLRTVYEHQSGNFLNAKLIIKSLQGLVTLHFTPLQHQILYDLYLAIQDICLVCEQSLLKQHSAYSRADLILRKMKYVARQHFRQLRQDLEDDQIPSQNEYFSSNESKRINYYSNIGLKPSSSQGSLTTPFQLCLRSCNSATRQLGLQRNASTANIATPHMKTTPYQQNSDGTSAKSELITPNESLTYYFEDTFERDPEGDLNHSVAPHSLTSYNSMASLPHSKRCIDSKYERHKIEEIGDGLSKISTSRSNLSSQRQNLTQLIQGISLPLQTSRDPVKKVYSQLFPRSPSKLSQAQKLLKRERQSQSQGGLTTQQQDKENILINNLNSSPESPPLNKVNQTKFTLSTIHQAKSSGRSQEEEEEKANMENRDQHNRQSTKLFYSIDKPPLSTTRRLQSTSTRVREDQLRNSSTILLESKVDDYDTERFQSQIQFCSVAPTLQTFNSQGSLKDIMHIQDYRENSHPVSPSPPKPNQPTQQNEAASPFKFNHPVSRSRVFHANNSQRTKEGTETYLSTAVTPINDKTKGRNTIHHNDILEFKFMQRDNQLDKENKSPLINSRGQSQLDARNIDKELLATETAWVNWSNNLDKGRNGQVVSNHKTTLLLEETKALHETANDATESDLRSELQDICADYDETNNYLIETDRLFSKRSSTSSMPTARPQSKSRAGLSSKAARMHFETNCIDPELASLIQTNASTGKTDRQASCSLSNSLRDQRHFKPSKEVMPPASARNPRIRHPFSFKTYEDSEQDMDQLETERKWRTKTSFRKSNSVLQNSSRNTLVRQSLTHLKPETSKLQKLRDMQILYKEKYLKEKEKMLEMKQAHLELAHSHQCQQLHIAQLEEEVVQSRNGIQRRLKLVEEKNQKLEQELAKEKKKYEAEKRARIRAQAHFDILATRFRQVEKHLIPKNICLRQHKTARGCTSLTRF